MGSINVEVPPVNARRKVIIDTDVGLDDAQAVLLTLMDPSVDVIAITCVGGNTTLENVCRNILKVLSVANRLDIPVYRGCKAPLIGNIKYGIDYHGKDGLGDCDPEVLSLTVDPAIIGPEHATSALIRLARQYPGEISVLCLAPLTNLAIAMKLDLELTRLFKDIYIMGGNHAGEGNATTAAEFNFHHDPEAASIVLSNADCQVMLIGWEATSLPTSRLHATWAEDYFSQRTPQGLFLSRIHQKARDREQNEEVTAGLIMCDEWVAGIFLDPAICVQSKVWPTSVELAGTLTRGQCVVDKRFDSNKATGKTNVRHVLALDVGRMQQRLMAMVQAPSFPPHQNFPSDQPIMRPYFFRLFCFYK